jgi:tyrosine-protein phosphatase SIW14
MKAIVTTAIGVICVLAGVAAPVAVALGQQAQLRRFHVVREGVLYRSAQLSLPGLERVIRDHGIRTIVTLRDGSTGADVEEQHYCEARGIRFVRIPPHSWDGVQGAAPIDAGLRTFLDTLRDPARLPALVHCYRGVHRTGQYVAAYRVEYEGWGVPEALREMVDLGYDILDQHDDVRGYFASYKRTGRYSLPAHVAR